MQKRLPFDAYIILDFEATCINGKRIANPEVIEFPMVIVDAARAAVVTEFQRYVRPVVNATLTTFCTELTGICQGAVSQAKPFPHVFSEALEFLKCCGLSTAEARRPSYCMVTCGDWDLKTMLPSQMNTSAGSPLLPSVPECWSFWCNIKKFLVSPAAASCFDAQRRATRISGMMDMLELFQLPHQGRHHSGIDDCRNIASVVCELLKRGCPPLPTTQVNGSRLGDTDTKSPDPSWCAPSLDPWTPQDPLESAPLSSASPPRRAYLPVDKSPAVILACVALGPLTAPPNPPNTVVKVSKALSHILRHSADEKGIPISSNGFVAVDDLLSCPQFPLHSKHMPKDSAYQIIEFIVNNNDKRRFTLGVHDQRLYIAANQGHSMENVHPEMKRIASAEEVPVAVHGTNWKAWEKIKACGYMSSMSRVHIHFAKGLPKDGDVISGMRSQARVLLYLDVDAALADGIEVLESLNGVILTAGVNESGQLPLKYIKKVVDHFNKTPLLHAGPSAPAGQGKMEEGDSGAVSSHTNTMPRKSKQRLQ